VRRIPRHLRWTVLASVLVLVGGAACGSDHKKNSSANSTSTAAGTVKDGGQIVFGADQEPTGFNIGTSKDNGTSVAVVIRNIWPSAYRVRPDFSLEPYLLDGPATVTSQNPFTVEWKIKAAANWSDGTPVTADDFEYYWQHCNGTDKDDDCASTVGYDQITKIEKPDPKTVRTIFKAPFSDYESLFGNLPPSHIAKKTPGAAGWNTTFNDSPMLSAGPYMFDSWQKGSTLTLVRNDKWWGPKPHLDKIVYRFLPESSSQPDALRNNEVNMIYPQPQLDQVNVVKGFAGVSSGVSFGPSFEHLTFNFKNSFLAVPEVRQAIAYGVDRQAIVTTLMKPFSDKASQLDNRVYVSTQKGYEAHGQDYLKVDVAKAQAGLEKAGFTKGKDGIYEKGGKRLTLRLSTTAGNKLREQQGVLIQAQMKTVGIDIRIDNSDSKTLFGTRLPKGDFDIANFGWVGTPFPASAARQIYESGSDSNYGKYTNKAVDDLMNKALAEVDLTKRTALLNQADTAMWTDLPNLPLYQKPTFLAFSDKYANIVDNTTTETPFWNVEEWGLKASAG
jgi:peptide/nickel transport system substrate-binding protein